jgi:hypothetical protein
MNKQERQSEFKPLHEKETQVIAQLEEEKKNMAQAHSESTTLLQEHITTHIVEVITDKSTQVKEKGEELAEKFHILEKAIQGVCTT